MNCEHREHDAEELRTTAVGLLDRMANSSRQGQRFGMQVITHTCPPPPLAISAALSSSRALFLDVVARCSSMSPPLLLGYTAAHTILVVSRQQKLPARLTCRVDEEGSVEVRLEPTEGVSCTNHLSINGSPLMSSEAADLCDIGMYVLGPEKNPITEQAVQFGCESAVCSPPRNKMHGESVHWSTAKPRVAGLWVSLTDLPLSHSSSALSVSNVSSQNTSHAEKMRKSDCSARLSFIAHAPSTPHLSHVTSCCLGCETADSTIPSLEVKTDNTAQSDLTPLNAAVLKFSAGVLHLHEELDDASETCAKQSASLPTPALHTSPELSTDREECQPDTSTSLELPLQLPADSDQRVFHAQTSTDEEFEDGVLECKCRTVGCVDGATAHAVSFLSSSLQNAVSPPMSSVDGDEGGCSGLLPGGTLLGGLDSVDQAVTDNWNNSEVEPGALSEAGGVSATPSVTGYVVDAAKPHESPASDMRAQLAGSSSAAAIADDSDCGCDEECDGIDGASNVMEGDALYPVGSISGVCDEKEGAEGVAELPAAMCLQLKPSATAEWAATHAVMQGSCDNTGGLCGAGRQLSMNGCKSDEPWLATRQSKWLCDNNDLEDSTHVTSPRIQDSSAHATNTVAGGKGQHEHCAAEYRGDQQLPASSSRTQVSRNVLDGVLQNHTGRSSHLCPSSATAHCSGANTATPYEPAHEEPNHFSGHISVALPWSISLSRQRSALHQVNTVPSLVHLNALSTAPDEACLALEGAGTSGGTAAPVGIGASAGGLVRPVLPPLLPAASSSLTVQEACAAQRMEVLLGSYRAAERGFGAPHLERSASSSMLLQRALEPALLPTCPLIILSPAAEDPPDVPIRSNGSTICLFSLLDQHLLDRILMQVSATTTLNPVASVCRRFRNACRRITGSATLLPSPVCCPPVDPVTGALDLRPLRSFPALHTLRLPKFDRMRTMDVLPVELFRLRMLTLLTYLDIQCAAYVPTFQPLRLLPSLRHLSCAGASLNPPPDLPELPNCEVMLYANRGLSAATRRNVLSTLPPLAGLRVPSKAPAALLQQIGSSPSMSTLTYLRLGSCQSPALDPLAPLTRLVRLHLHVVNGHVTPLTTLSMLTYLHLHGHVDDLAIALGSFRKLQKLSLIKCKRLRADELRAVGSLSALTSLELPCSKASPPPRDIRPLGRLKSLQHLSLAMPEAGIAPLTKLSALTFLRLKFRAPDDDHAPAGSRLALTASLFSMHLALTACSPAVRALSGSGGQETGGSGSGGSGASMPQSSMMSSAMGSMLHGASHAALSTAVTLAGAAAFPLAVHATKRAWTSITQTLFPPGLDAGRLIDLCHMTQLEWLEVKSSTMPTPAEWSAALRPLTRLRRLDVRNTSFRDPLALQDMPYLRVVLISGCTGLPRSNKALQDAASLRDDVEIRR